jgi:hypothetical protein
MILAVKLSIMILLLIHLFNYISKLFILIQYLMKYNNILETNTLYYISNTFNNLS